MSMLYLLYQWIDPIEYRKRKDEERRKREAIPPDVDPDLLAESPPLAAPRRVEYVCSICGGVGEDELCLECLSGTRRPRT